MQVRLRNLVFSVKLTVIDVFNLTVVVPLSKSIISLIPMMLLQIGVQMKQKIGMVRSTIKLHEQEVEMMPIKGAVVVGMQPNQAQTT